MGISKEENVKEVAFIALENRKGITVNEVLLTSGFKYTEKKKKESSCELSEFSFFLLFFKAKPFSIHE